MITASNEKQHLTQVLAKMIRALAFLASLLTVSAFAPSFRVARSSLKMSYENEIGALKPTGFWDPLGLSKDLSAEEFTQRRTAELKHGRVAMLAVVGYLVQDQARLPGAIDLDGTTFQSIPNGVAALSAVPLFGWFQIGASIGFWEIFGWKQVEGSTPGDFSFGDKYLKDPINDKTKELQNGRLAMLAIGELLTHDLAKPAGESIFTIHHF